VHDLPRAEDDHVSAAVPSISSVPSRITRMIPPSSCSCFSVMCPPLPGVRLS
jgi:hypothetical protein